MANRTAGVPTFETRIHGTCIKHHMGPAAIKLHGKFLNEVTSLAVHSMRGAILVPLTYEVKQKR